MEYTTYDFYTTSYFGDSVDESSFAKWLSRATDKLNRLCFGRITDDILVTYNTEIQKATCALIDCLYEIDRAIKTANDPQKGNVKSMSSGGQSVSFGNNETVYNRAMSDSTAQYRLMVNAVMPYLAETGLMYVGV